MGAAHFTVTAWGRTPEEAFRSAQDEAEAEYGHRQGYSGAINAKHDFVLLGLPPRVTTVKFLGWVDAAYDLTFNASGSQDYDGYDHVAQLEARLIRTGTADKPAVRREISAAKRFEKTRAVKRARLEKATGPYSALVARAAALSHGDKRGPCLALEIVGAERKRRALRRPQPARGYRLFLFTGKAPS